VFSNDASLLIPAEALTADAAAAVGGALSGDGLPQTIATTDDPRTNFGADLRAFLTIAATHDETHVQIELSTAIIGDGDKIPAKKKGELLDVTLNALRRAQPRDRRLWR